jgi:hypothetical protein
MYFCPNKIFWNARATRNPRIIDNAVATQTDSSTKSLIPGIADEPCYASSQWIGSQFRKRRFKEFLKELDSEYDDKNNNNSFCLF